LGRASTCCGPAGAASTARPPPDLPWREERGRRDDIPTRLAKLRTPAAGAGAVARPQLDAALRQGDRRPLVSVVAGPGWGKTTLGARWAADHGASWYRVDASDRDPAVLAAGLAAAAGDGAGLAAAAGDGAGLAAAAGDGVAAEPLAPVEGADPAELALELLVRWRARGPVQLVLDEAHVLRDSPGAELLGGLVSAIGPSLHLVLLAAEDLGLVGPRQRGSGEVLELDATHLALDVDVVGALLDAELDPDPALAARIVDATGGWPAAIRLVLEALRDVPRSERSSQLTALTGAGGPVAGYLLAVVLPSLDPAAHRMLVRVALLGTCPLDVLAAVLDTSPVELAERVGALVRRGLLRRSHAGLDGEVSLAPVVRRVLLAWDDPGGGGRDELVDELVAGVLGLGAAARALEVLTATGRWEEAAAVLEETGDALLRTGELLPVERTAAALPAELRTGEIERLHGHALAFRGEWSAALACLAVAGVGPTGPLPTQLALPLGLAHHLRGDLDAALPAYARGPAHEETAAHAVLTSWHATCHWLRGELDEARAGAASAIRVAEALRDDDALAHAHTVHALLAASDGDRRGNAAHYRQALTAAQRAGDRLQQARILNNLGSHHLEDGRYEEAKGETDRAIDLASALGYVPILGVAWCNRAEIGLRTGALDQAIADATAARELFARIGSRNESYAEHLLGDARRERGELIPARMAYERALRLAGPAGDHQGLVPALIGLSKILASTDPDRAAEVAARAVALDNGLARADALLACAWVELARNDHERARRLATEAREDAETREATVAVAEAVTLLALLAPDPTPGLREALERWREVDAPLAATRVELGLARRSDRPEERARAAGLEQRLQSWGCPPDGGAFPQRAVAAAELRPRTSIRVLGGFVVERAGRPVPRSAWGSRKARDLLKVLVVRAGRRVSREQLADLLWPDEPYDEVANRLSVALSVVRGVLAGEGASREAPIRTAEDAVELDATAVDIDLIRFEGLADEGLRALRGGDVRAARSALSAAEEAYGGDLLEDDLEAAWVADRREDLRQRYVSVARALAGLVVDDDPDHALRLLLRVLDRDGYDEPAHLEVCRTLLAVGRHGEARRRHRIYTERMADLDLPAVPFASLAATPGATRSTPGTAPAGRT
jgi:ATP/maltotriose-dependent transcriptional regulator MalT/DNA-binding SARP family transcriptional activator